MTSYEHQNEIKTIINVINSIDLKDIKKKYDHKGWQSSI